MRRQRERVPVVESPVLLRRAEREVRLVEARRQEERPVSQAPQFIDGGFRGDAVGIAGVRHVGGFDRRHLRLDIAAGAAARVAEKGRPGVSPFADGPVCGIPAERQFMGAVVGPGVDHVTVVVKAPGGLCIAQPVGAVAHLAHAHRGVPVFAEEARQRNELSGPGAGERFEGVIAQQFRTVGPRAREQAAP